MARPRTPTELLELRGAFRKDPQRRRSVGPKAAAGIGEPPAHLKTEEAAIWHELVGNSPAGVLTSADRPVLEMLARLMAKFREDWLTGAEFSILKSCLTELGWTPAARSKVAAPAEDKPDGEFSEFLQ
jgi:phage terminase small subunit